MADHNAQAATEQNQGVEPAAPSRWRFWRWGCLSVLVLFLFAYLAFNVATHLWFQFELRTHYNPDTFRKVNTFLNEPVTFPKEPSESRPISDAFKQTLANAEKQLSQLQEKQAHVSQMDIRTATVLLSQQANLSGEDWDDAQALLLEIQPYIDALHEIARQIGRELTALRETPTDSSDGTIPAIPKDSYNEYLMVEALQLKSRALVYEDKIAEALEHELVALHLLVRRRGADMRDFGGSRWRQEKVVDSISAMTAVSTDSAQLRKVLDTLELLDPHLNLGVMDRAVELQVLSDLRQLRRRGKVLDLTPRHRGSFYVDQILAHQHPRQSIAHCLGTLWESFLVGNAGRERRMLRGELIRSITFMKSIDRRPYIRTLAHAAGTERREQELAANMDVLRLTIAGNLYRLKTGGFPSATTDLVPNYIPNEIRSRETDEPYPWDANGPVMIW